MPVCRLPAAIQEGILEERISTDTALALNNLGLETGVLLAESFRNLQLSHSKQREIILNINDISRRDGIDAGVLLRDTALQALLSDPETDHVQKANSLRNHFRSKRYPSLTHFEETFKKETKQLSLGKHIRLKAPQAFESGEYAFTISIKSIEDLENSIKSLQNTAKNPALQNILHLKKKYP